MHIHLQCHNGYMKSSDNEQRKVLIGVLIWYGSHLPLWPLGQSHNVLCTMCVCERVHGRDSGGEVRVHSPDACKKKQCFSLSVLAAWLWRHLPDQQLEQIVVMRILHDPAGSGSTPPGVQVLQSGECSANRVGSVVPPPSAENSCPERCCCRNFTAPA